MKHDFLLHWFFYRHAAPATLEVREKLRNVQFKRSDTPEVSDPLDLMQIDPETAANTMLCFVNQASYLLRNQLRRQEEDFLKNGGFTQRMYRFRKKAQAGDNDGESPSRGDRPMPKP